MVHLRAQAYMYKHEKTGEIRNPQGTFHVGSVSAFLVLVDPPLYLISLPWKSFLIDAKKVLTFPEKRIMFIALCSFYYYRWPDFSRKTACMPHFE